MKKFPGKIWLLPLLIIYLLLWAITAVFSAKDIDSSFDRELARGSVGMGTSREVNVQRVPFFDSRDITRISVPAHPWRSRSEGFAIAPFVVIDSAAWQTDPVCGYSGVRLVWWFFGRTGWTPLKTHWVS